MIVYVESNFVLEIALRREEYPAAEAILSLAENDKIELRFPGFILSETFGALRYRRGKRSNLYRSLQATLKDIKRSASLREPALIMEPLIEIFEDALETDFDTLHLTLQRMLSKGKTVTIDQAVFQDALTRKIKLDLALEDSIIFASIVNDLDSLKGSISSGDEKACFLSRDKSAFSDVDEERIGIKLQSKRQINEELKKYGCKYLGSFEDGLNFIQRFA